MTLALFIIAFLGLLLFGAGLVIDFWIHYDEDRIVEDMLAKYDEAAKISTPIWRKLVLISQLVLSEAAKTAWEGTPVLYKETRRKVVVFVLGLTMMATV